MYRGSEQCEEHHLGCSSAVWSVIFTIRITNPDVKVAPDRRGLRLEQDQVLRSLDCRHCTKAAAESRCQKRRVERRQHLLFARHHTRVQL